MKFNWMSDFEDSACWVTLLGFSKVMGDTLSVSFLAFFLGGTGSLNETGSWRTVSVRFLLDSIGGSGLGGVGFLIGACVSGAGFSEEEMAGFFRALLFFWGLRTVEYGPTEGVGWDTS